MYVVDGITNTLQTPISLTNAITCARTLSIDVVAHRLYAACFNGLTAIDTKTNTIVQQMPLTGALPITHAISSQYFDIDSITGKIYIPLEETNQLAVVAFHSSPKIDVPKDIAGNEGSMVTIPVSFTDTDSQLWTVQIDYGDGSHDQFPNIKTNTLTLQHTYTDNGIYPVSVTVSDAEGSEATATTPVTIWDVFPTVGAITVANKMIPSQTSLQATALFTDPGKDDTHTAKWDWGDGITTNGIVTGSHTSGIVTGSHTYSSPGVYKISLTVEDKDSGATTNVLQYIIVYDPKAPFVGGVGTFDSPAGAYTQDPKITGKVTIGFSIKNIGMPYMGTVLYNFRFTNTDFHAIRIDSIIKSGLLSQIKGSGLINNAGNYAFLLVIQNNKQLGTADTIRLKVWNAVTGNSVYDTQMNGSDTALPVTKLEQDSLLMQ
jgi:PKD repeat protein